MPIDPRLEHLRTQPYLRGLQFQRKRYKAYRPGWEHDHCVGCWAKFAEHGSDLEPIEREGYSTCSDYKHGENYEWVCPTCFDLFRAEMDWSELKDQVETPPEIEFWRRASDDLGIEIETPFEIVFADGGRLEVPVLLKNFGREKGMLIVGDYDRIKPYVSRVIELGYGYACEVGRSPARYDRAALISVLLDWGWSGPDDKRLNWLD